MKTIYFSGRSGRRLAQALAVSVLIFVPGQESLAQSAAELLEKGIYTEETRGDLKSAMDLYQRALDEARSNETFGAQAMYRLALCHRKLGHENEATTLLEKLIAEYPSEEELVARARDLLPGKLDLQPIPWRDRETMILHYRFPAGTRIGMTAYYAHHGHEENQPVWTVGQRTFVGHHSASAVVAEPESWRPIRSRWMHTLIGDATAEYQDGVAVVKNSGGKPITVELEGQIFDNEQAIHALRRLPLKVGYETKLTVLSTLAGGTIIPLTIKVTKEAELEVPAGKINAFKVELHPVNQAMWISNDENRYLVRMEAGGVIGDLVKVQYLYPGQPNTYQDDEMGFSINVPADWLVYKGEVTDEKDRVRVAILDPSAKAHCMLFAYGRHSLKPEVRSSLKAWAEERAQKGMEQAADFKVRQESWSDSVVSGYPAISFIGDYTEGEPKKAKTHYSLMVMGQETAAHFFMMADADEFAEMKTEFDRIIASYVGK